MRDNSVVYCRNAASSCRSDAAAVSVFLLGLDLPSNTRPSVSSTAALRVASLSRLRGVPARIVAILGFDDRAFTSGRGNGDDILLDAPRIAERDFHAEERLGLLNLLSAASDAVLLTCNGFDVTNNKELPMAVPLAELTDAVAGVIATGPEVAAPKPVLIRHARQLTDPVNFGVVSEKQS